MQDPKLCSSHLIQAILFLLSLIISLQVFVTKHLFFCKTDFCFSSFMQLVKKLFKTVDF